MNRTIQDEIVLVREELMITAERYRMNLLHPEVIQVSQKLDLLIVQSMRSSYRIA
jgi:hypothetical protein